MFKKVKLAAFGAAAAAALSIAAPAAQAATTTIVDGGVYHLPGTGPQFSGVMDLTLAGAPGTMTGPGGVSATFVVDSNYYGSGAGELAIGGYHLGLFTNLTAKWIDTATNAVLSSLTLVRGDNVLSTLFNSSSLSQTLMLSWDSLLVPTDPAQSALVPTVRIDVAPVPLPATGLLLMGALGGAAMLRRRKQAA